jgi:3'-5' exonuclease
MFSADQLANILFLDIETASVVSSYDELPAVMKPLWDKKSKRYQRDLPEASPAEIFPQRAAIHAEFGKVVCISCGYLQFDEAGKPHMTMKSFFGEDEYQILSEFGMVLNKYTQARGGRNLCAHNGKEFDYPYLGRRFVVHGLPLPHSLQVQGKKPWEVNLLDTMELWKFGDYKAYTSLELLSAILGIPSPKDDIDGSQVGQVFWEEKDYDRIRVYCEQDVKTTAQVMLRMARLPLIEEVKEGE